MQPIGHLPAQEWLTFPETVQVMEAIMAGGKPARFVGGCVRDAILGLPISDIDISTPETPEKVMELLEQAGIRAEPIGLAHGSILAIQPSKTFDITTLRSDVETFGRHARVNYHDNWLDDAARRDFTMNAIYADPDGSLYDPMGGIEDLKAGRVRFIGDAYERIREDCLRILRFFRFQAYYGRMPPSASDLQACEQEAPYLRGLSTERVWSELKRTLLSVDPAPVMKDMHQHSILSAVFTHAPREDAVFRHLPNLIKLEDSHKAPKSTIRRLACLIGEDVEAAQSIREDLPLSTHELSHLIHLIKLLRETPDFGRTYEIYRILYFHGPEIYYDYVLLTAALDRNNLLEEHLAYWRNWTSPTLPIRGQDLLDNGLASGPKVGILLKEVTDWWLEESCKPTRDQCLQWLGTRNNL